MFKTVSVMVAGVLLVAGCSAAPEDATEPGASSSAAVKRCHQSSKYEGDELSGREVAGHLRAAGFAESEIPKMVCIASHESNFFSGAHRVNANCSNDLGLFQINDRYWLDACDVTADDLLDPATNARCAKMVRDRDPNHFRAWYGYRAHVYECDHYRVP